ncbi:MAG: MaoC/PaaZ C-terminal domain-containing protein [Actinomycetota bacterium]|nr:MaoC/PaaZ C-terminal domain-containing protein [Actinomycetota bacterium]
MTDLFTPVDLRGEPIGPVDVAVTADRVALYVDATSDDPTRWSEAAPPGFGSVLLFAVADEFLYDPRVVPFTRALLHLDQSFTYVRPLRVGALITVTGTVTRVRQRAGSYFVTFSATACEGERPVMESVSTFVLSDQQAPPSDSAVREPSVHQIGVNDGPLRSASRHDLIRYSAASRDFNPLHWDHDFAIEAGLPGTVVHGLLMYAWLTQEASRAADGRDVVAAKIRFRNALRPAQQATITSELQGDKVELVLAAEDERLVTGTATVLSRAE